MQYAAGIDLALLAICGLLICFAFAYRMTMGAALRWAADQLDGIRIGGRIFGGVHPFSPLAARLRNLDTTIMRYLGTAIEATSHAWKTGWNYTAYAFEQMGDAIAGAAEDTFHALDHYRRYVIPAALSAAVGPLAALVYQLRHLIDAKAHVVIRTVVHTVTRIEHTTVAKAVAIARPLPFPRLGQLEREAAATESRLRDYARRISPAALAAIVVATLARLGLGWLRCSRVNRLGRRVCGMDESVLESLLADTLLIVGTISLVEFAEGMQGVMETATEPIRHFWRA